MSIRKGKTVVVCQGNKFIVGPVSLVEKDFVNIQFLRPVSGKSQNFDLERVEVFSLEDLVNEHRRQGQGRNYYGRGNNRREKELKGVIKHLLTEKFYPGFQRKALRKLKGIPRIVSEEEILRILRL